MIRRLYYIFPDVAHCEQAVNELLLKRITINHMHVVARDGMDIGTLPEASVFQRSDIKHSLIIGILIGGLLGVGAGFAFHYFLKLALSGLMAVAGIVGVLFGAWAATMIGMMTPSIELKAYIPQIESGKLLLMLDVPKERVEEIEACLAKLHPEANFAGMEPTIPAFP